MEKGVAPRKPLQLTPATVRRLQENDPTYKFVDYYGADGNVKTMSLEEYHRL